MNSTLSFEILRNNNLIAMRQEILNFAICKPGKVKKEFGVYDPVDELLIIVRTRTKNNEGEWILNVSC